METVTSDSLASLSSFLNGSKRDGAGEGSRLVGVLVLTMLRWFMAMSLMAFNWMQFDCILVVDSLGSVFSGLG